MRHDDSRKITFCLAGVAGKMGREVVKSCKNWKNVELASAVDLKNAGTPLKNLFEFDDVPDLLIAPHLKSELQKKKVDVLIDFTTPEAALSNALCAIENGVIPLIGTSGLSPQDLKTIEAASAQNNIPALVVPNFSVGAALQIKFSELAVKWMPNVEIIEAHHEQKLDAPSSTAFETALRIHQARLSPCTIADTRHIKLEGVRGGRSHDIPIHSIRLNGLLAEETVIFGGQGETLRIHHTVIDRSTYMSGVEIAIKAARSLQGLTVGLDSILFHS